MKLSPLDIKKQDFSRAMRGYDAEEVEAFLDMLASQWEALLAEQRRADERVRELQAKLEHYERVEEALQEALSTAREGSRQALENAKQEAATIIKKAVGEAEDLTRGATHQRDTLLQEIEDLKIRREEMVARLRAFLTAEVEVLARFDERTRPADVLAPADASEPLPAPGAGLLAAGSVMLDPEEPGRLPELAVGPAAPPEETPEAPAPAEEPAPEAPAPFAHATPSLPDEVPLDTGALDAVLEEFTPAPPPAAEVQPPEAPAPPPPASGAIEIEFGTDSAGSNLALSDAPLSFDVFEPANREPSPRHTDADGKPAPGYAPDEAPRTPEDQHTASTDEIEKIKRILNDLD